FNAISIWDFRRGEGGYFLKNQNNKLKVDGWGRIYKNNWYTWDGVFKNEKILDNWKYLRLPSNDNLIKLDSFLKNIGDDINLVLSLPGLFEKTWQSMGFVYFSKCLRNNIEFIKKTILFFYLYLKKLILLLQKAGASIFLIADDLGYNNRLFIQKKIFEQLFYEKYTEIVDLIHNKKNLAIIHSDGYISNLVDLFIQIGFDGLQSIEPNAGNNIFNLFKDFRDKICFIGNLDNGKYLTFGTISEVKLYVENLIKKSRKYNSSLVVSPTQQINSIVRPENVRTMIKTTKILSHSRN
ncbi:MAG: hypothetical protein KGD57_08485, partial [Candidatus Lokiarchaeota archaeon]|nr:hypothetical protein [Candidatus Lokiarchaeota archaeon]